ncbi:IgGFc-binding protein [Syngnathoides biaculeatus]|uniref:IgGFc-binding protein n=1 Tax=Syngnathoides biaculeatus TaxID=300417 RepID=UPI002ADD429C|nr:IgGFc-binding protein [Syngnathoides biaculeatus]
MFDAENFTSLPQNLTESKFSDESDNAGSGSTYAADVGHYLITMKNESHLSVCGKKISPCDTHCGHKRLCSFGNETQLCSSKTKICSAWGDSYYRTFDGKDFVLLGNCNYTFVQTTCPGVNASTPLQVNIARAYLADATVSSIHSLEIKIQGFNISMVKGEQNQIRVNGHREYLPVILGDGILRVYPSGLGVVLDTSFGITLQYDWVHNIHVEAGPELYGLLCGLCGNANDGTSNGTVVSNGTNQSRTIDFTLPWVLDSNTAVCMEDCEDGQCQVCGPTQSYPGKKGKSFENKCTILKRKDGPFSGCHVYIDPKAFVHSCENNLCLSGTASSVCKVFTAYANMCQRLGGRVQNWRAVTKCHLACPVNSHYEECGSSCQATCGDPEPRRNCSLPCVELCQCNRGYLLSDGKCVLPSMCGCVQNGSYYLPAKTFWKGEQCQEKCLCQPQSKTVMCAQSRCQVGEVCKVINGVLGCHAGGPGLCVAQGEPHVTTFDGRIFEVHGNCSYLLTSHCPAWGELQDFSVEVQSTVKKPGKIFRHVEMSVTGYSIQMSYMWPSKVMVNGQLLNLPSVLSQGKVMLYLKGQARCIETDFGVIVTYSPDIVTVTMPKVFAGNLCGLCGNFNDEPQDDLVPEDFDIMQAIRPWRTSYEHECWDVPMNNSGCSPQKQDLYQGKDFCGRLTDPQGPFQRCHKTVDPQEIYDNCVHDLCNWNQTTLCQVLSSYVAVCQEMGAGVDEWRASSFCPLKCPPNSEYHLCSSHRFACAQNPSSRSEKCKEGCFCKPGFFHSAGECVPNSECGCSHNGSYYELQEKFYPDENCFRSCVCVSHNVVKCRGHTCPAGTKCAVKHGRRACHATHLKCTIMGGRHLQTFHGHAFDLNNNLRHLLFQPCDNPGFAAVFHGRRLHLRINDMSLMLSREYFGKVEIDGVVKALPVNMNGVSVLPSGLLTRIIAAATSTVVTFGGPSIIQITIPATDKRLCGLCGNSVSTAATNKQRSVSDDFVQPSSRCFSPTGANCSVDCHDCLLCNATKEFESDDLCGTLLAPEGSFGVCHSAVDPMPFFQNCVNDLCRSNNTELFCDSLRQYAFACQDAGAEVKPWRGNKCALSCTGHSHYNVCVGACSESCAILSDVACPWPCYEGCQCDAGYLQSTNGCVRPEQCGCFYLGQYYEVGEVLWNVNCTKKCNCCSAATLCCRAASCPRGQNCVFKETWHCEKEKTLFCPVNSHYESCGTACPSTCGGHADSPCAQGCEEGCQCDPGFLLDGDTCVTPSQCGCTYNGDRYHSNETFWADSCTKLCTCDPHTHQIHCHEAYCGDDEYCGLQNGTRSCVPHNYTICRYSDHRVVTFDKREYNFLGTCQYQLLGVCEQSQGLDVITVDVQTDAYNQSAQNVFVGINGQHVKLNSQNPDSIEVNGVKKNMPVYVNRTALVLSLGLHTYIYSNFGFLSVSKEGLIVISLSSTYANTTCGLCGNFNSDPADDLTVNGTQENLTPEQFGKAWRVGINHWCAEGCQGGSCPNCSSEALNRFSDPTACGKILEVNGPFKHCHSKVDPFSFYKNCVSDLCLYGDVLPAVCRSLAEYAEVCLRRKALVYAWRTPEFCYDSCPSSTTYNTSISPVEICLGWLQLTIELPPNIGENCLCEAGLLHSAGRCVHPANCGCLHGSASAEYILPGQEVSTCEQTCSCHPGGNLTCVDAPCSPDEECALIRGVQGCHPKVKKAHCSINGSQLSTFDGLAFELNDTCNSTLVRTCALEDPNLEPVLISLYTNHSGGYQIYLEVNNMTFEMSTAYPEKIQVNEVSENLPFSGNNVTVHHENGRMIIKTSHLVEIILDLGNYLEVKLPNAYKWSTCGLCGNYNGDLSDDLQLPNCTATSDSDMFGESRKLSSSESSCNETCNGTCPGCLSLASQNTTDLSCSLVTQPTGPFSPCHNSTCPQKYYALCLNNSNDGESQTDALCGALEMYEAACKMAGVNVHPWRNITGCAQKCPQFSNFSQCANVCSSLCPEISFATECPGSCEEGCQCDADHLYDGHECVPAELCGCMHEGTSFQASENKLLQNCTMNCTCGPPLICEAHKCPPLHSCLVLDGMAGCHADEPDQDPCEGKCDISERCYLSNGVTVCESKPGQCWTWGSHHYHTFDGFNYDFKGTCTYLLSGSKGGAGGTTPFTVSKKSDCKEVSSMQLVTVQAYGFVIAFVDQGSIRVNGQVNYIPVTLLRGKIEVSNKEGKTLLKTDFGLNVLFDWNSTILIRLDPNYKAVVYGLCGNFNGDPQDDYGIHLQGFPPATTSVELAQAYRIFDGDHNCCTGCKMELNLTSLMEDAPDGTAARRKIHCNDLVDPTGQFARCHSHVNPESFYERCIADFMQKRSEASLKQATSSYSVVCDELSDFPPELTMAVSCPPNSHYKTCGSACPPTCGLKSRLCHQACVQGCFCNPGFLASPEGCVPPRRCGCTDSTGKYYHLNAAFWIPDDCGQFCICQPGKTKCSSSQCPKGMSCKRLPHKRVCQADRPQNCTVVTGLHFTSFDGHRYDFRDSCAYILVQTNSNLNGFAPFNITISDASCHKRFFHSLTLTLSIYDLEMVVRKEDPDKLFVNGLHKPLPYLHHKGHVHAFLTPSSLVIHVDTGLQLIIYKTGTMVVVLPGSYASSVRGLCGNANSDPYDDQMMPDEEQAPNTLAFAHSWRLGGAAACRSRCASAPKNCPSDAMKVFEGGDFCGVLGDELGPFAECALVLSPKPYFKNCLADACFYGGYYLALCNAVAAYSAACQAAQLPVRHWRSDTFCGIRCPKNSHYELCGPRCPVTCAGLSSATTCSGGCEEGCQCDAGYILSNDRCVLEADCGCLHEGQYHLPGYFSDSKSCQICYCHKRKVSCRPSPCKPVNDLPASVGLFDSRPWRNEACEILAGFGYITFDNLVIPHYGACTYLVSERSPNETHGHRLLLSFEKHSDGTFIVSKLVFVLAEVEMSVDPEMRWKIQVNGEDHKVPYSNDALKAYEYDGRLVISSVAGVRLELSAAKHLRLSVPRRYNGTVSGLCGNFNGDKSDDLELKSGYLAESIADFLTSWSVGAPGQNCSEICGKDCGQCTQSFKAETVCDLLLATSIEFNHCWNQGIKPQLYRDACLGAICGGADDNEAVCLALEAYAAACQAEGITVGSWREKSPCSFKCPDRSSPSRCVDASSSSCPALLRPGSSAVGCSGGCQCQHGNVFDGGECVPVGQCGCVAHGRYIQPDEQLYSENCTERCWCHPLGGALCEKAACGPGQMCLLSEGSWNCAGQKVCQLRRGLRVSTFNGRQPSLAPKTAYKLTGLCNEKSPDWFSLISYYGPCNGTGTRLDTVFQILLVGFSIVIQDGVVKANGDVVPLPYTTPSGVLLSSGVAWDKSEAVVVLKRNAGLESELQMEIGVTNVTLKAAPWYAGKLCGICGDLDDPHSRTSVSSWALSDFQACLRQGSGSVNLHV